MPRAEKLEAPVTLIRSGYATDALWEQALLTARACGRRIVAIDGAGRREEHEPA